LPAFLSSTASNSLSISVSAFSPSRCGGAERLIFDKAVKRLLRWHLGGERRLMVVERWLSVYVIIGDDGSVVTPRTSVSISIAKQKRAVGRALPTSPSTSTGPSLVRSRYI